MTGPNHIFLGPLFTARRKAGHESPAGEVAHLAEGEGGKWVMGYREE